MSMEIIMQSKLTIAIYKPKSDRDDEMLEVLKSHTPLLKELGLISNKPAYLARSSNGHIIEIFEWLNEEAKVIAHSHPLLQPVWSKMMEICEFPSFSELPESASSFPNFETINID